MIALKRLADQQPIQALKEAYLRGLVFPMDAYWQSAVVGHAPHWQIEVDGQQAGYCAISSEKRLLQFYVTDPFLPLASELFAFIAASDLVECASAGTFEPAYLAHCLDHQHRVTVRSYLFQDHQQVGPRLDSYPLAKFQLAGAADAERLAAFYGRNNEYQDTEAITAGFGSLLNFAKSLIAAEQVFFLSEGDDLLGVGECRISSSQPPFADLGMITDRDHRRQGLGGYMLAKLKGYCYERGAKPICSCAAGNTASRKTIERAGFITRHRLLDMTFSGK